MQDPVGQKPTLLFSRSQITNSFSLAFVFLTSTRGLLTTMLTQHQDFENIIICFSALRKFTIRILDFKERRANQKWHMNNDVLNILRNAHWLGFFPPHKHILTCKINWGDSSSFPASVTGRGSPLVLVSCIFICKNVPAAKYRTSHFYS